MHFMGIHYDYKSTRGDKAMKKEAKRKARIDFFPVSLIDDFFFNPLLVGVWY